VAQKLSHSRTQSASPFTQKSAIEHHGAKKLRDSDHCDRPVCAVGTSGIRNLRDTKPSQFVCEERKGLGRSGGRRMTPSKITSERPRVRFELDDDDIAKEPPAKRRTVSGLLQVEDGKDSWF